MGDLIQVFRMHEVSAESRAAIIIALGNAINNQYAMNLTEPIVYELVSVLEPENEILKCEWFREMAKKHRRENARDTN